MLQKSIFMAVGWSKEYLPQRTKRGKFSSQLTSLCSLSHTWTLIHDYTNQNHKTRKQKAKKGQEKDQKVALRHHFPVSIIIIMLFLSTKMHI